MNEGLTLGPDGEELCHYFETCKLEAYADPYSPYAKAKRAGKPYEHLSPEPVTIGWGDTGGWKLGDKITQEQADALFRKRMSFEFGPAIMQYIDVTLEQHQFDALSAFIYNIGVGNFKGSTVRKKINAHLFGEVAQWFLPWNKSKGVVSKGLQRRRLAESLVWQGTPAKIAIHHALEKYP